MSTMHSKVKRINRLVTGLNINEDAATVDMIFRITSNVQGEGNSNLRRDMIKKTITQWDPFCNLTFDGDNVRYSGSNWLAVQNRLKELGYLVAPAGGDTLESDETEKSDDPNDTEVISNINDLVMDNDLTDSDKIDKIGELVLNQIESRSRRR